MKNDAEQQRLAIKFEMIYDRGGQTCLCDRCGNSPGVEMHELIHRSRTSRDSMARTLTYQKYLCVILCRDCHAEIHDQGASEVELWLKNYVRYGYDVVYTAFQRVQRHMKSKLGMVLPDPTGEYDE